MFFPHSVDKDAGAENGGEKCTQAKMSVTTVGDVVNIKKWGRGQEEGEGGWTVG